jgi:maleylacetate reductase
LVSAGSFIVKAFSFDSFAARIVFGIGRVTDVAEEVDRLNVSRVLIVAAPSSKSVADDVAERLGPRFAGTFSDVQQHVPIEAVQAASAAAADLRSDCVVAIGGGSAIGFGKAVVLHSSIPMIAVPTTYSGSEVTSVYGITRDGQKQTGRDLSVLPKVVVYDPALTVSLPPAITGPSGMNAMAHCVEALYAREWNPVTSLMATEGLRALIDGIPRAVVAPDDLDARSDVLYGSFLAGSSLAVVGMAIHHRICHVLGGSFGLSHGETNAVILPHVALFNAEAASDAVACIAQTLGVDDAPGGLFDFAESIGAPTSLQALGMHEVDLPQAARLISDTPPWNPRPVEYPAVLALLEAAFLGQRPSSTEVGDGGEVARD